MNPTATHTNIRERLIAHLNGDGTANDSETESLYREAHKLNDNAEIDTETIEWWAWHTLNAKLEGKQ